LICFEADGKGKSKQGRHRENREAQERAKGSEKAPGGIQEKEIERRRL